MEKRIEELSINAWPSTKTLVYDGWILRFEGGYTRRANSISPLYESKHGFDEKIIKCEQLYNSMGLNTVFKLIGSGCHADLDLALASHGYRDEAYTSVQVMELSSHTGYMQDGFKIYEKFDEGWFNVLCSISGVTEENTEKLRTILSSIVPERYYVELVAEGKTAGCAVGVIEDGYIGIFDVVVAGELRGKGYGRRLMEEMLSLGKSKGVDKAYLQVMLDNPVALRLYESLGFRELYQYWYRVKKGCINNG